MKKVLAISVFSLLLFALQSCQKDDLLNAPVITDDGWIYDPVPFDLSKVIPAQFPAMEIPADNPMTEQGVKLGRMLFFDPILSGDSTLSCAGCHSPENSFSDFGKAFSTGIDGFEGNRNSMNIINAGYLVNFFWDGRAASLEDQAAEPVPNPVEMHLEWTEAEKRLMQHKEYPKLFFEAFGMKTITKDLATKALAQFMRIIISGNSTFDKALRHELFLDDAVQRGLDVYMLETKGDCFHCHGDPQGNFLLTDNSFRNNGLNATFNDLGRYEVTGKDGDRGKFKVPTLRNVELTAPYMHDGRFKTLEEVIEFYNSGTKDSPTVDINIKKHIQTGGLMLTQQEKDDLLALLKSFTDTSFVTNPLYQNPFE